MPLRTFPFASPRIRSLVGLAAVFLLLSTIIAQAVDPVGAQEDEPEDPPAAERSAIAVPFVGTAEVWCTDRNPSTGTCSAHHGSPAIDIGLDIGVPIHAAGAGTVLQVETECSASWCRGGAGLFVEIEHADGTTSRYLHLSHVEVEADDIVVAGDQIGLSGNSGSARSPHLHYDEHFPRGTRTPFGPMFACVDDEVVEYPSALGYDDWNDVPFGTELSNEGFECLGGAVLGSPTPDMLTGPAVAAIRPPAAVGMVATEIEITVTDDDGSTVETTSLPEDKLFWIDLSENAGYSIRQRVRVGDRWRGWSKSRELHADRAGDRETCRGLFASSDVGTSRIDVLIGTDGNDTISGGAGDDIICTGDGHDIVAGGDGNDWIDTGAGRDDISGGEGRDRINSGPGSDTVFGGGARDRIVGGSGADEIVGGTGADLIIGSTGDDRLLGEGGRDRIKGGRGNDELMGGGGHDRLDGNDGENAIDGGSGTDSCSGDDQPQRCE